MKLDHEAFLSKCGPWALITGASSGIGEQFAKSLAPLGFNLVLVARRKHRLDALSSYIKDTYGVRTRVIPADLSQNEGITRVIEETGSLDIGLLILNAGVDMIGSYFAHSTPSIQNLISVNVTAVASLASTVGRNVARRGRGGVIFVSSLGARPVPYMAAYGASKAFVSSLGLALNEEWSVLGVQVMVFEPGVVHSEMADRFFAATGCKLKLPSVSAEQAVSKCLRTFGKRVNCTTGVRNAIYRRVTDWVPHSLWLPIGAANFRTILPREIVDVAL